MNNSQAPQITGSAAPFTSKLTPGDTPAILRSWQIGQTLTAEVLAPAQDGVTLLRINGALMSTQTTLPLTPGQTLQVKVIATGAPPVLQIMTPETTLAPTTTDTLNQSLRAALPRQAPLSPLLANLVWLAQTKNGSVSGLPPAVVETARQVFSTLSTPQDLSTGAGLSASLQRSGLFLEARLSQADTTALETDFKAGLLRLREVLLTTEATASAPGKLSQTNPASPSSPAPAQMPSQTGTAVETRVHAQANIAPLSDSATSAPPPLRGAPVHAQPVTGPTLAEAGLRAETTAELLNQVQGGLARVQLSQLASLPNSDSSPPAWVLELPVRHAGESHVIQVRIEADDPSSHPEQAGQERKDWLVTLALDLKGLGPLHIKVSLREEKVSASFWADQGETVELLTRHLDQLRNQMNKAGLNVASISCATGCRPPPRNNHGSPPLLDIKI
ncbi:MAG: flagellar hook-length control protein FliK [Gammaproteobacteria bacterium]|nr:flagellar hook-length control protein FliK [Gammaproteobacteria bacterium]